MKLSVTVKGARLVVEGDESSVLRAFNAFRRRVDGMRHDRRRRSRGHEARNRDIRNYYRCGASLLETGKRFGLSRERVRQILGAAEPSARQQSLALRALARSETAALRREQRAMAKGGCDAATYWAIPARTRTLFREYRRNCQRNYPTVPFALTLWEWLTLHRQAGVEPDGSRQWALVRVNRARPFTKDNMQLRPWREVSAGGFRDWHRQQAAHHGLTSEREGFTKVGSRAP